MDVISYCLVTYAIYKCFD